MSTSRGFGSTGGEFANERQRLDVEGYGLNAGLRRCCIERLLAPAGNDYLVAQLVQFLSESPANATSPAGDEDGVASKLHVVSPINMIRALRAST